MFLEDFELRGMITEHLFLRRHPQNRPQRETNGSRGRSKEVTVIDEAREEGDGMKAGKYQGMIIGQILYVF